MKRRNEETKKNLQKPKYKSMRRNGNREKDLRNDVSLSIEKLHSNLTRPFRRIFLTIRCSYATILLRIDFQTEVSMMVFSLSFFAIPVLVILALIVAWAFKGRNEDDE